MTSILAKCTEEKSRLVNRDKVRFVELEARIPGLSVQWFWMASDEINLGDEVSIEVSLLVLPKDEPQDASKKQLSYDIGKAHNT